jgi:hypothetical protein
MASAFGFLTRKSRCGACLEYLLLMRWRLEDQELEASWARVTGDPVSKTKEQTKHNNKKQVSQILLIRPGKNHCLLRSHSFVFTMSPPPFLTIFA